METVAFVQARMGSTRLPQKVLEPLAGQPVLLRVVERLALARGLSSAVILTSRLERDDAIEQLCAQSGVACVRGDEQDVLDRFHTALVEHPAERVVRITADCPLVDPDVVTELLDLHRSDPLLAYASVATGAIGREAGYRRFPDGLDAEVFTARALETAWREARDPFEREHVTPFIWRRPERFPSAVLECESDHGDERWTIDYPDDLAFVRAVYERLGERNLGWRNVLALLEADPRLRVINRHHRLAPD